MSADITGAVITAIRLSPNPATTGQSCLVSVGLKEIVSRQYTLSASAWSGTGPYTQTLAVASDITPTDDLLVYGDHTMSVDARVAEFNAVIRAEVVQAGRVKFTALGIKPTVNLTLCIITGPLPTLKTVTISAGSWSGSGPWTAQVGMGKTVRTAMCGQVSGSDNTSAKAVSDCGMHVSAVSGATVTIRAMLAKPSTAVTIGVAAL